MKATSLLAVSASLTFSGLAWSQPALSTDTPAPPSVPAPVAAKPAPPAPPTETPAQLPPAAATPVQFAPVASKPAQAGTETSTSVQPVPVSAKPAQPAPAIVKTPQSPPPPVAPKALPPVYDCPDQECFVECCEEYCCCSATRFWLGAEVLFWRVRPGPVAYPLAIPNDSIRYGTFTGVRLDGGWWFDDEHTLGVNLNGFLLEQRVVGARGNWVRQASYPVVTGSASVTSVSSGSAPSQGEGPISWVFDIPPKGKGEAKGKGPVGWALDIPPKGKGQAKGKGPVGWGYESGADHDFPATSSSTVTTTSQFPVPQWNNVVGSWTASSASQLGGVELNVLGLLVNRPRLSVALLGGFRYLNLDEDLFLTYESASLVPNELYYLGNPLPAGSAVAVNDLFWTHNYFYGGQVGAKANWNYGRFNVGLTGKLALGSTQQVIHLDGDTNLTTPAGNEFYSAGGVLTAPSNLGRQDSWHFTVIPEVDVNLGWQVTPHLRLNVGYTYLYWSSVQRPGNVFDRTVDGGLLFNDAVFGVGDQSYPAIMPRRTAFWTQGVNVGLEVQF